MSQSRLYMLMNRLHQATSFEQAAELLLEDLFAAVEHAGPTRLLRGMIHLRPGDAYRGFVVRERAPGQVDPTPSTTAWRWVELERRPVLLDVATGVVLDREGEVITREAWPAAVGGFRSRDRVLERQTSHILALPLCRPGKRLDGFVSLELAHEGGETPALWSARLPELELMVGTAALFLGELPRVPAREIHGDTWLPVIGPNMQALMATLEAFAWQTATLLLQGETGVGKTRMARWCCQHSPRADKPFESVNLLTVPENLREALLFGHARGAFTDARTAREGLVARVDGGTLFIDEIDKLPLSGQAMLLSLLDDGQYRVLGDSETYHADVRFIVGTNADLKREVAKGRFREDLYYRIRVLPVRLPPLRERRDEIAAWARYFLERLHRKQVQGGSVTLEHAAGALLEGQSWPGNLRDLDSVMARAYAFARRESSTNDLTDDLEVRSTHVEHALALSRDESPEQALWSALARAAQAFVDVAVARPEGLALEHAEALSGMVLDRAIDQLGVERAYAALDKANYLKGGNRKKLQKQHAEHLATLEGAIGPATV